MQGALGFAAGLALGLAAAAAPAEPVAWDQARVTELVVELDLAVRSLLADPGLDARQSSAIQQKRHRAAIIDVREFERWTSDLARKLRGGRGYDQTRPLWDQMMLVADEIDYYATASWLPKSASAKAERAVALIDQIAPFYAGD